MSEHTGKSGEGTESLNPMLRSFSVEPFDASKTKWSRWVERLEGAFHLFGIAEASWLSMLLHFMGAETYDIVADALAPTKPYKSTYAEVVELLEQHYNPRVSEMRAVMAFMNRKQDARRGETITEYIATLQTLAEPCNFGEYLPKALRNQFVFGLAKKSIQDELLDVDNLTLARARDIAMNVVGSPRVRDVAVTVVQSPPKPKPKKRTYAQTVVKPAEKDEHNYSDQGFLGFEESYIASIADASAKKAEEDSYNETMDISMIDVSRDVADELQEDSDNSSQKKDYPTGPRKRRFYEGLTITADDVREVMAASPQCHDLVHTKLPAEGPISKSDRSLICRTICRHFLGFQVKGGLSINNPDKQAIAEAIVQAYPCLASTDPERPPESEWFWYKNGEEVGNHTGCIQHWVRNTMSKSQFRGKTRKTLIGDRPSAVGVLQNLIESPENRIRIFKLMAETFAYRQALRVRKKPNDDLITQFPHLLQHGGEMIDHEFNLMYPNRRARAFESIIPLCLVLEGAFAGVSHLPILALLRVMNALTSMSGMCSGTSKKPDPLSLSPIEEYAFPLVRWRQTDQDLDDVLLTLVSNPPFIFVDGEACGAGDFHAIVEGTAYNCGDDFCRALDLVMKAYKVFRYSMEIRARRVVQFFDVAVYKVSKYSELTIVNSLCERFVTAADDGK